ncbi:MAG: hypothetical protein QHH15_08250, partial [Candidatus Thermoplasmatota archaeon]|nr:hypothetical protein [Candidatus Thermoplasmatota archaeon]
NGAIVKVTDYFNYSSDDLTQSYSYEYIYTPALDMMRYPISVGEKWENNYNLTTIDTLSGSSFETQVNESYECEKITSEFEMNKTFECYVIKKTQYLQNQSFDTRYYLSEETGPEPVRLDVEYNGFNIVSLRIVSYNIGSVKEKENKTPGFELVLLILALFFISYLKRKR